MKKSRILVLALALSAGLAGANPGQPALAPAPAQTISQAPPSTVEVTTDPAAAWDVVGAGSWWRKVWKGIKCFGRGLLAGSTRTGAVTVVCYFSA